MIARYLSIGLAASMAALSAYSQPTLADRVSEAGAEWMFGQWESQSDSGDVVRLNVSWDLDKHVVLLHVKTSEMESKGYTVVEPEVEGANYYSFDTRGAVGKGSWNMESGDLTLRVELRSAERGPVKLAFVFGGTPAEGLQVRMHSVDDSGNLSQPGRTTKFKKAKATPAATR